MDEVWKTEAYVTEVPETLCREGVDAPDSMRRKFEKMIRDVRGGAGRGKGGANPAQGLS